MNRLFVFVNYYAVSLFVYGIVGFLSALVEWSIFYAASLRVDPVYATFLAFLIATLFNYLLSRRAVFISKRNGSQEFGLVIVVSAAAFVVNFIVFQTLRLDFAVSPMAAKICGTGIAFLANFALRQFYVFSSRSRFETGDGPEEAAELKRSGISMGQVASGTRQV